MCFFTPKLRKNQSEKEEKKKQKKKKKKPPKNMKKTLGKDRESHWRKVSIEGKEIGGNELGVTED